MTELDASLAVEMSKKKELPAFDRIPTTTPDRSPGHSLQSDIMVTLRDGVSLACDVYLPEGDGPFSTILSRIPYGKTEAYCYMFLIGAFFASKGYAFVVQDVRGKWGSEGTFNPNMGSVEISDGYDTIDWITLQDWSNGRVGMWGESYFGFTSYAGAVSQHPALIALAPGDITLNRYLATFRGGCLQLNTVGIWAIEMMAQEYQDLSTINSRHLPLAEMANAAGIPSSYFDQVIANPIQGPFWNERSLLAGYDAIRIPVLHWDGWYDNYLGYMLQDWQRLTDANAPKKQNHLMVGPWDHECSADTLARAGLMPVTDTAFAHRWDHFIAFFDHYLMGLDNGFGAAGQVHYFTLGADKWQDDEDWPPPGVDFQSWYLRGNSELSQQSPGEEAADQFTYDPAKPIDQTLQMDCWGIAGEMGDRREIEARDDVLVYTSSTLEADMELTGPVTATLHISSSATDTDFTVVLCDVFPDGRVNKIQDGILRTGFREIDLAPQLMEPGKIYALDIDLWATSYLVGRGHQLRVEISSSDFNRYDRNPNTGAPFGHSATTMIAEQTVYRSAANPSHIILPVKP
ncbi:MAG: putative CocE/NonD family hydrolase [Planctomycetota bacterium]|jgi:putative CocE/NonD family hydrolase|tara:strand:- start:509 stop:2227 length:1719 start_codon:yes stop_codon:yes gene_type:complete